MDYKKTFAPLDDLSLKILDIGVRFEIKSLASSYKKMTATQT
jgi:hypothetical protein